jgi:hypothetical protein
MRRMGAAPDDINVLGKGSRRVRSNREEQPQNKVSRNV